MRTFWHTHKANDIKKLAKELIISTTLEGQRMVLLEHGKAVEYHEGIKKHAYNVGDIYLGIVRKILPSLNAAFVDIGHPKDAFLHYLDLGPQLRSLSKFTTQALQQKTSAPLVGNMQLCPDIDKKGCIDQVLKVTQKVLVQITKEPISTKGPRLSSCLSIAGRYLILVPFGNEVSISKKIKKISERKRLTRLITSIKPSNFSVVVRTVAQGKEVALFDYDLKYLLKRWEEGIGQLTQASGRKRIIPEINQISSILRDVLDDEFAQIIVDENDTYEEVNNYINRIPLKKEKIVQLYKGKTKIFEHLGLERQLKLLFSQIVNLEGGSYLVIEHTEAMHTIDVNSGRYLIAKTDQEETALQVNLIACREIARQIRLRKMGGIIIVDFIGMRNPASKRQVYQAMKEHIKVDLAKINLFPLTRLGLMQITRERTGPTTTLASKETCPSCLGSGTVENFNLISDQIEKKIQSFVTEQKIPKLKIFLHPYLHAYFTQGFFSKQKRWYWRYWHWITLVKDHALPITSYKFFNEKKQLIATNPPLAIKK